MPVQLVDTAFSEIKVIVGTRFEDERGFFTEMYKKFDYEGLGIPPFVQDNLSESSKGVVRGLHWQEAPHGQGKLVFCLTGSIMDFAVDIRKESATFGQYIAIELNSKETKAIWIPEGFAHGFQALEEETKVYYKVTNYWDQQSERSLNIEDPSVGIDLPEFITSISTKDKNAPYLAQIN